MAPAAVATPMASDNLFSKPKVEASVPRISKPLSAQPSGPNRLFNNPEQQFGDWRDDILRDGYVVLKGAIPRDRADAYGEEMMTYLEQFAGGLGFDRSDPATVTESKMPVINEKGMCLGYGIAHETFTWNVRQEPGVIDAFEKIYDTKDLIVSFDGVNMTFPDRTDLKPNSPWPHQDQDPAKPGFRCMQGLVNLLPNGPNDGGLIVCRGAHLLSEEFHREFADEPDRIWAWTKEWYGFTSKGMAWLEEKGCEWVKLNAEPGDLLLWDSRTPHYNLSPTGSSPRFCIYTCFMPVTEASNEDLVRKKHAFETLQSTTHWPNAMHVGGLPILRDGKPCPYNTGKPRKEPQLSQRGWQLTGIPYMQA